MTDFAPTKGMTSVEQAALIDRIPAEATLAEKIGMMSGRGFFAAYKADGGVWGARQYRAGGGIERLGVAAFWFTDRPRGVARGNSTCFPCTMARGASFDTDLERRIGEAMSIIKTGQSTLAGSFRLPTVGRWFMSRKRGSNGRIWDVAVIPTWPVDRPLPAESDASACVLDRHRSHGRARARWQRPSGGNLRRGFGSGRVRD